jgi:hypothetical protein
MTIELLLHFQVKLMPKEKYNKAVNIGGYCHLVRRCWLMVYADKANKVFCVECVNDKNPFAFELQLIHFGRVRKSAFSTRLHFIS